MSEESYVFRASRLTSGNALFPVRIVVSPQRVTRVKPRLIGSQEESIPISKVASVSLDIGLLFADVRIDSTGGSAPITSHGHSKSDARSIRDLIERFQQAAGAAGAR